MQDDSKNVSVYNELQSLVTQITKSNVMPSTEACVYARSDLREDNSTDPRYQVSVMIKRFF